MKNRKVITVIFALAFLVILGIFIVSVVKTDSFNKKVHQDSYTGDALFRVDDNRAKELSVAFSESFRKPRLKPRL